MFPQAKLTSSSGSETKRATRAVTARTHTAPPPPTTPPPTTTTTPPPPPTRSACPPPSTPAASSTRAARRSSRRRRYSSASRSGSVTEAPHRCGRAWRTGLGSSTASRIPASTCATAAPTRCSATSRTASRPTSPCAVSANAHTLPCSGSAASLRRPGHGAHLRWCWHHRRNQARRLQGKHRSPSDLRRGHAAGAPDEIDAFR